MARVVFRQNNAGEHDIARLLLSDIDKAQQLREHTVNPPGQERYVKPVDEDALQGLLDELGVTDATAQDILNVTVFQDNAGEVSVSQGAIAGVSVQLTALDADGLTRIQDMLSVRLVETGNVLLSFDRGVMAGAIDQDWIIVMIDAGDEPFSL